MLAFWLGWFQGRLWRHGVVAEAGDALDALAAALGAEPRPRWTGWEVSDAKVRVVLAGGLFGYHTRIWVSGRLALERDGLLSASEVLGALGELGAR